MPLKENVPNDKEQENVTPDAKIEPDQNAVVEKNEEKPKKKRGRKPNPAKRTGYFYEEEEAAFREYVQSTNADQRSRIFREKLYPAFTKMIESISRRYGLYSPTESFEDTFYDTMSFLVTKVNNFDASKGYKAYSYCGTICKRYLLAKRTKDMKRRDNTLPYDIVFGSNKQDNRVADDGGVRPFYTDLINNTIEQIKQMTAEDSEEKLSDNERSVGFALIEILENWENLFVRIETRKFNKTSVYFFIKEYTLLSSKEVREAMKRFKNLYFFTKKKLIED